MERQIKHSFWLHLLLIKISQTSSQGMSFWLIWSFLIILKCRRQWSLYWIWVCMARFWWTAGVDPLRSCQKPPPSLFVVCNGIKCFISIWAHYFSLYKFTAMNILSLLTLNKIKSSSSGQLCELTFNQWHDALFWRRWNSGRTRVSTVWNISITERCVWSTLCTVEVPSAALPEEHTDLL